MLTNTEAVAMTAELAAVVTKYTEPVVVPPVPRTLYYGYFGYAAGNAAQQAAHCNLVFLPSWGFDQAGWQVINDRAVDWLNETKTAGIGAAVLTVDYLVFNGATLSPTAALGLRTLFDQLKAANVLSLVKVLYLCDEPDGNGFSDATIAAGKAVCQQVAAGYPELAGVQFWVIYGDTGNTPGMASFDAVGKDDYGKGSGALNWYSGVPAGKGLILVPGGADPWRTDPGAFVAYALTNKATVCVLPFLWVDYGGGRGIGSNVENAAYIAAGKRVLAQK